MYVKVDRDRESEQTEKILILKKIIFNFAPLNYF